MSLTELTAKTAADAIRAEMARHFLAMHVTPSRPLAGTSLTITHSSWGHVTVDGWVSPEAADLYASYSDYFALHYHTGVVMFTKRIAHTRDIAPLIEALVNLFSCERLQAQYLLN